MPSFKNIKVFYKDRLNFWLLNVTILIVLATWALFLFKPFVKSPLAVLHYNIYFGFDVVGHWIWLFIIPGIVLLLSIANIWLAVYFWTKEAIWSYFLLTATFLLNAMIFIFLFNILNYNL